MQRVKHQHSNNQKNDHCFNYLLFYKSDESFYFTDIFKTQTTGNSIDFELMRVKGTVLVMQFILSTKDPFNIFFTIIILCFII